LLSAHGFRIVHYDYDARSFGNCLVLLESPTLRLRFTRDRGITSGELASRSDPETWYDACLLLSFLHGDRPDASFEGLAVLLQRNWKEVEEALTSNLEEIREREMRRRDETMKYMKKYMKEMQRKLKR
jgi:hypothetical protein